MDHIEINRTQEQPTNWPQMVLVVILMLLGFGLAGRNDYAVELEKERDELRVQLERAQGELRLAAASGGIACNGMEAHYAAITAQWRDQ